jgi:GxxExxY protein
MRVHRRLGPGLLETAYRACLVRQLGLAGLECAFEVPIPIDYEGVKIGCAYRADVIVQQSILLELKAVDKLLPIHHAQVLTYLRLSRLPVGLLLNFNVTRLKDGIHRFIL